MADKKTKQAPTPQQVTLTFSPPDDDAPGYLNRVEKVYDYLGRVSAGNILSGDIREMAEFLLPYVTEPTDRDQAREALLNASRAQFYEMLRAIIRSDGEIVPFGSESN